MIFIISPHIDDAVISCNGLIKRYQNSSTDVHVCNIFTISNSINEQSIVKVRHKNDTASITNLRKKEEDIVSKQINFNYLCLDYLDLPLRNNRFSSKNTLKTSIKNSLIKTINSNPCVFPLGVGHPDHKIISEIGIEFYEQGENVIFYEDLPYIASRKFRLLKLEKRLKKRQFTPMVIPIDIIEKLKNIRLYESQVSTNWIRDILNYSYNYDTNLFFERYWVGERSKFEFP